MSWHDYQRFPYKWQQEWYDNFMGGIWCLAVLLGIIPMAIHLWHCLMERLWPYWHMV